MDLYRVMGLDSKRCVDTVHNDLSCAICLDILSLECIVVRLLNFLSYPSFALSLF